MLPEYLRGDDGDGLSGSEEEKDAKRMRSTSTTPRSGRDTDPDECDRITGFSSVQPPEMERFGDGNVTDAEGIDQGVANDSGVSTPVAPALGNCPGFDLDSRGYESASLAE